MTAPACHNCLFHHTLPYVLEDGTKGDNVFCRFNPPAAVNANQSALLPVAPDGWCGQWERKPVKREKAS